MDPLTHTATGLFLSRAGLNRLTPRSVPILLLAANAPDIDIVTSAGGAVNYLHFHRHLTHSLIAMPVMALLPVVLIGAVTRGSIRWWGAFFASLVAVASHLLLDWTNVYGIRLLLPFSGEWLRLDWTPVIDLAIWGVFLVGIAGPFLARLVGSEIGSGKTAARHHGRGFAWLALTFLVFYNCGHGVLHARSTAILEARVYQGEAPVRVAALPQLNPLAWRGLVETEDFYEMGDLDLSGRLGTIHTMTFFKVPANPAIEAARRAPAFQTFLGFAQFPLWRMNPVSDPEGGRLVELFDMRFGTPLQPGFLASAILDRQDKLLSSAFQFGPLRPR